MVEDLALGGKLKRRSPPIKNESKGGGHLFTLSLGLGELRRSREGGSREPGGKGETWEGTEQHQEKNKHLCMRTR